MKKIFALLLLPLATMCIKAQTLTLLSPDGRNEITFQKSGKQLLYSVRRDKQEIIKPSAAGLQVDNRTWEMALGKRDLQQPKCFMDLLMTDSVRYGNEVDSIWRPLYGERSEVRDHYRFATLYLSRKDKSMYRLNIEVRAYDEGVAFRYFFPEHPQAIFHKVVDDLTEYTLLDSTGCYAQQWAQAKHDVVLVDSVKYPVERPLTMRTKSGVWLSLLDADVDDWCLTKFQASSEKKHTLVSKMYSPVDIVTYYATPWKVIMLADKPADLLQNNDIVLNLNPPCEIKDTSFIKPGKIFRANISTEAGLRAIDFCKAHNMQYMLFDWLWYLPCTSHDGDATKVVDKLDMQRVVNYGKSQQVGVWLYVNQHALMKQQDEVFRTLSQWGVVGVKSGFVQYASHRWATWLHDMVRKASENGLMINIHDEFRPSGFSRTYPNLLTQEGICGNEEFPDATHNVTLPFTRMLCGAADYTICYFDKRLKNTHAHQLAASVVFFSPLLTLFWYDTPERYSGEKEIKWFEDLETTFDDSRILFGYPGKDIAVARRKGDVWFLGVMTNNEAREERISLDFLPKNTKYTAEIYTDGGEAVPSKTHVLCSKRWVNSKTVLRFNLLPRGGAALRLTKAE